MPACEPRAERPGLTRAGAFYLTVRGLPSATLAELRRGRIPTALPGGTKALLQFV